MLINIYAEAVATNKNGDIIKGRALKKFTGIECEENFTEYIDANEMPFKDVLGEGYMYFRFAPERRGEKLMVHTEYVISRFLEPEEARKLVKYTQGQWSDGIGEGFEQKEVNSDGDFLSPWFPGQKALYQMKP